MVSILTPFIAASPDGIIYDEYKKIIKCIEIKCLYTCRHFNKEDLIKDASKKKKKDKQIKFLMYEPETC